MNKLFIVKDQTGKYYTGKYPLYWINDINSAKEFESEKQIRNEFTRGIDFDAIEDKLKNMTFPIELISILK